MGTYTTNKNLFMPTVGETGWGELVNGNFSTIDTFLKPITISGSTYTFTGNHVGNQSGGTITATKITNSGTLTNTGTSTFTGKITANGGIGTTSLTTSSTITSTGQIVANGGVKGNLIGNVTGNTTGLLFVKGTVGTSGDENYATLAAISGTVNASDDDITFAVPNYSISYPTTKKHSTGVFTRRAYDLSGTTNPSAGTRVLTVKPSSTSVSIYVTYYDSNNVQQRVRVYDTTQQQFTVKTGTNVTITDPLSGSVTYSIPAGTTYKVKYATP